jgi:hypothetical protein
MCVAGGGICAGGGRQLWVDNKLAAVFLGFIELGWVLLLKCVRSPPIMKKVTYQKNNEKSNMPHHLKYVTSFFR